MIADRLEDVWNDGILEQWNSGVLKAEFLKSYPMGLIGLTHYSNSAVLAGLLSLSECDRRIGHYGEDGHSNIPLFQERREPELVYFHIDSWRLKI